MSRKPIISARGGTRAWAKLKNRVVAEQPNCWLRLPGCTIRSETADHYYPQKTHPELHDVTWNLRGACNRCNRARRETPVEDLPRLRAKMEHAMQKKSNNHRALGFFG